MNDNAKKMEIRTFYAVFRSVFFRSSKDGWKRGINDKKFDFYILKIILKYDIIYCEKLLERQHGDFDVDSRPMAGFLRA